MTWTLRVYDTDGNEIAWLTIDPYEYQITDPSNATDKTIRHIKGVFSRSENPVEETFENDGLVGSVVYQPVDVTGKEHAEYVKTRLKGKTRTVSLSMTVADE